MEMSKAIEGRAGVARVEAFSDGVIAIIVTIMVLELHAPEEPGLAPLLHLWPTLVAYILSYIYVAIYWINHHRLFSHARVVTGGLLWSNIALLFSLSFIPFTTSYLGKQHFGLHATLAYLAILFASGLAYHWLHAVIRRTGARDKTTLTYHTATTRKGFAALAAYALGIPLSFWSPTIGVGLAGLVALFWMLPWSPLDALFVGRDACENA
jgi:uncharacterized membrane protein